MTAEGIWAPETSAEPTPGFTTATRKSASDVRSSTKMKALKPSSGLLNAARGAKHACA